MEVRHVTNLGVSHSWRLQRATLVDGREVFIKEVQGDGIDGLFTAEAHGLRWLAEAMDDAPVPEVLAADERRLVLPWLPSEPPSPAAAERFGRELASMHSVGAAQYGAPWQGFIADLPLDNTLDDKPWAQWYAERRLAPYLRLGAQHLGPGDVRLLERVIGEIDQLAGPPEPPSRIHGDLWSGNLHWSDGRGWLIDPAAHGGHRETDLAMLALFGASQLDRILGAYQETTPLADGWQARVPLHQLYPLLVHVALFGGAYRGRTVEAAMSLTR